MLDYTGSWNHELSLVEFAYNNRYHSSFVMASFEASYGRNCRATISWDKAGERKPAMVELINQTVEVIKIVCHRLQATQSI